MEAHAALLPRVLVLPYEDTAPARIGCTPCALASCRGARYCRPVLALGEDGVVRRAQRANRNDPSAWVVAVARVDGFRPCNDILASHRQPPKVKQAARDDPPRFENKLTQFGGRQTLGFWPGLSVPQNR